MDATESAGEEGRSERPKVLGASDGTPGTARPGGGCDGCGSARDEEETAANAGGAAAAGAAAGARAAVPGGGTDVADAKAGGVPKQAPAGAARPSAAPAELELEADAELAAGTAIVGCDPR